MVALSSAQQSSTNIEYACAEAFSCSADKAIDGSLSTKAITYDQATNWWSAKLQQITQIKRFLIYLDAYAAGQYSCRRFVCNSTVEIEGQLTLKNLVHLCQKSLEIPEISRNLRNPEISRNLRNLRNL